MQEAVVKDMGLVINEYDMKLLQANKELIMLRAYCTELQQSHLKLEEEIVELKYQLRNQEEPKGGE